MRACLFPEISREQNAQEIERWNAEFQEMFEYEDAGKELSRMNEVLNQQETLGYDDGTKQAVEERIGELEQRRKEISEQPDAEIEQLRETVEMVRQANMGEEAVSDYESELEKAENKKRFYQSKMFESETDRKTDYQTEALQSLSEKVQTLSERIRNGEQIDEKIVNAIADELRKLSGDVADTGEAIAAARTGGKLQSAMEDAKGMDIQMRYDIAELEKVEDLNSLTDEARDLSQKIQSGEPVSRKDVSNLLGRIDKQINALGGTTSDVFAEDIMNAARTGASVQTEYDEAQKRAALEKRTRENVAKLEKATELSIEAEKMTQMIADGKPVSEKKIADTINQIYKSLSEMDEDISDILFDEISETMGKAGNLAIALDDAKARDAENMERDYERYANDTAEKELAKEKFNALSGMTQTLKNRKVYINESQAADMQNMTGKTIPQINRMYGTRFTQNRAERAIPLEGQFYIELAKESGGFMDPTSLNPAEDVMRAMMERRDAYRSMRRPVEKPKDRAQVRRAAKGVMGGNVGAENTSSPKNGKQTYRGIEVQETTGKADKGANVVKATFKAIEQMRSKQDVLLKRGIAKAE